MRHRRADIMQRAAYGGSAAPYCKAHGSGRHGQLHILVCLAVACWAMHGSCRPMTFEGAAAHQWLTAAAAVGQVYAAAPSVQQQVVLPCANCCCFVQYSDILDHLDT
jgi:hypothetical protein